MALREQTHAFLREYRFRPSKRKGQHFLVADTVFNRIGELLDLGADDILVDVGSGPGIMSGILAGKCRWIISLEYDRDLYQIQQKKSEEIPNLVPLYTDARRFDYSVENIGKLIRHDITSTSIKLLGNLPYYATYPILSKIQNTGSGLAKMVFLLQKEVADRILAAPGTKTMGLMTLKCQFYWDMRPDMIVQENSFIPAPKVQSRLLTAVPKHPLPLPAESIGRFFSFLSPLFQQKRKKLRNLFRNSNHTDDQIAGFGAILEQHNHSLDDRPERISLPLWLLLFNTLQM